MSMNWLAKLPRKLPKPDSAHIIFAYKDANGVRLEFTGQMLTVTAEQAMQQLIDAMKKETAK